jgi:hypothetical protein
MAAQVVSGGSIGNGRTDKGAQPTEITVLPSSAPPPKRSV